MVDTKKIPHQYLSNLDESGVYPGGPQTLLSAKNEKLLMRNKSGITREYIDLMSAYGAVNFGHCNPEIMPFQHIEADLAACFYPEQAEQFAQWLCEKLGLSDYCMLFQVGGSFAVSAAIALAQRHRPGKIVAIRGCFHGLGSDSLMVTDAQRQMALHHTPLIHSLSENTEYIDQGEIPDDWTDVSCLIFEPIQGANGYVPLEEGWLKGLVSAAQSAGVVVISDEIQCGYYRHGVLSPARAMNIKPDILLYSKSMTNGLYPFSAVVYKRSLVDEKQHHVVLAHTFQTSSLGCYAAMSVANYIDHHDINSKVQNIGNHLSSFALQLKEMGSVKKIHQTGPTISFEVETGSKELVNRCFNNGILIFNGGTRGERVRIAPPLTIPKSTLLSSLEVIMQQL